MRRSDATVLPDPCSRSSVPAGRADLVHPGDRSVSPAAAMAERSHQDRSARHPGYAGGMLAMIGIGVLWGNWVTLATVTLLWLALIIWRIHFEEGALLTTLDSRYSSYAAQHKRLVPLVW